MSRQAGSASLRRLHVNNSIFKKKGYNSNTKLTSVERTAKNKHITKDSETLFNEDKSEYFGRIDDYEGLFTTQQLVNVDFSKFENHVFFDSAVSKVHYAYRKILNEFPYDKTEYDVNQYFLNLDGFTKHIYDNHIPKNLGYLRFDGNNEVFIKDKNGNLFNDYKGEVKSGLFDINRNKFSFDFWLYIDSQANSTAFGTQIIFQKKDDSDNGITIYADNFTTLDNINYCDLNLVISNNNNFHKSVSQVELGKFNHVNFTTIIVQGKRFTNFYYNGKQKSVTQDGSLNVSEKLQNDFIKSNAFIGNGSNHAILANNTLNVTRTSGLIGYIDEFRFFVNSRKRKDIVVEKNKNIHSVPALNIYYKFNEPSGVYTNNNICLDSSGKKVHGLIRKNSGGSAWQESEISEYRTKDINIDTPIKYEVLNKSPVIFPNFSNTLLSQKSLLENAEIYDKQNPNVFWKLFPKYLFVESSDNDGVDNIFVTKEEVAIDQTNTKVLFGVTEPGNSTLINLITIWSRFFDQLKCYIDNISKIIDLNYDDLNNNKQSSIILPTALSQMGFEFKEIFPDIILDKLEGKNLTHEEVFSQKSIRQIQNVLWKRFLINSQDFIRSKGTINSIKSVFNSFGLEPDTFVSIREFNSQNKLNMSTSFIEKNKALKLVDFFDNGIINTSETFDNVSGYPANRLLLETQMYDSNNNIFLDFTSNWSLEAYVKFDQLKLESYNNKQSIFRIDKEDNVNSKVPYINLVFSRDKSTDISGTFTLYVRETNNNSQIVASSLNDVNLFDGKLHYICINRKHLTDSYSRYNLFECNSDFGSKNKAINQVESVVNIKDKDFSINKPFVRTGIVKSGFYDNVVTSENINYTRFEGLIGTIRLWQKELTKKEILVHKTDISNSGVDSSNIKDVHDTLILHTNLREKLETNSNGLVGIDNNYFELFNEVTRINNTANDIKSKIYIDNNYLTLTKNIFKLIDYIVLEQTSKIDYPENFSRVNINSLSNTKLMEDYENFNVNPNFSTESKFANFEDIRLSIDFSVSNFIDKEISKIILVNDYFTQNLSNASSLFEDSYQSLHELRNVFYEKLEKELNIKILYQIYKYYDNILEDILYQAVPSKVHYHGFNFVYESSIAERNKYQYRMSDSRIGYVDLESYVSFDTYNKRYSAEFNINGFSRRNTISDLNPDNSIIRKSWT
jgi:hypothetical protein